MLHFVSERLLDDSLIEQVFCYTNLNHGLRKYWFEAWPPKEGCTCPARQHRETCLPQAGFKQRLHLVFLRHLGQRRKRSRQKTENSCVMGIFLSLITYRLRCFSKKSHIAASTFSLSCPPRGCSSSSKINKVWSAPAAFIFLSSNSPCWTGTRSSLPP